MHTEKAQLIEDQVLPPTKLPYYQDILERHQKKYRFVVSSIYIMTTTERAQYYPAHYCTSRKKSLSTVIWEISIEKSAPFLDNQVGEERKWLKRWSRRSSLTTHFFKFHSTDGSHCIHSSRCFLFRPKKHLAERNWTSLFRTSIFEKEEVTLLGSTPIKIQNCTPIKAGKVLP